MKRIPQTRLTVNDYVFLLVAGGLFYLLNRLAPFPWNDDIVYQYIGGMGKQFEGTYEPITSFEDVITSQLYDYQHANGRFIVHAIVQCFCGLWGMAAFQIVNTFVFLLLCIGMIKIIRLHFNSYPVDKYLITFALFFLLPTPGALLVGTIAVAVNYLWTSCAVIWTIYLYMKLQRGVIVLPLPLKIATFLGAAIVGSLQESFTIGVSGALFFYYCFNFKKLRGDVPWLVIGFWVGTCFAIFAPANFARLEIENSSARFSTIPEAITRLIKALLDCKAIFLLMITLFVYAIKSRLSCWDFIREQSFWLLSITINALFIGWIAYTGTRQLTAIELFSILLLILLSYKLFFPVIQRHHKAFSILTVVLVGIIYIPAYQSRQEEQHQYAKLMKQAEAFKGEVFVATDFTTYQTECIGRYIPHNYNSCNFIFSSKWTKGVLSCYATNGKNPNQIKTVLPQTTEFIIRHCSPEYEIQENIFQVALSGNYTLSIVRLPTSVDIKKQEISVWAESNRFLGKIRNKIFNLGDTTKSILSDDDLNQSFVEGEWRYIVLPFIVNKVEIVNCDTLSH